jgi:hypothetical protein
VNFELPGFRAAFNRLPRDQHRHHGSLARAGRELQSQTEKFGIRIVIGVFHVLKKLRAGLPHLRGDLGKPNGGLHRLDLAEKRPDVIELVGPPVLKQTLRLRRYQPVLRIQTPPLIDIGPKFVDDGSSLLILLPGCRNPGTVVQSQALLPAALLLSRLRNRSDERSNSTSVNQSLSRLT